MLAYGNSYYIERISELEKVLAKKPRSLEINMIGAGEIPADTAMLIRSVLIQRSPRTRLVTNARSSLQGGSVLVWLLGDTRIIRDDARLFFRRADLPEDDGEKSSDAWKDTDSEIDPEEGDYARMLELINEFLPVKELTGRLIEVPVLRQFGLIENEKADHFLATVFARKQERRELFNRSEEKRIRRKTEVSRKRESRK